MKPKNSAFIILTSAFCISLFSSGCATTPKTAIRLDSNFYSKNVDEIVLMPVVDRRIDKKGTLEPEKDIRQPVKEILERKGYRVILSNHFSQGSEVSQNDVAEMDVEDLSALGTHDSKTLLFIYVEDVIDEYMVLAYNCKVEATGSLIHKSERVELWRDKGIGTSGQAGLISGAFAGMDKRQALSNCLSSMFASFPDRTARSGNSSSVKPQQPMTSNPVIPAVPPSRVK
ncbi:MAG TPA: hypothetical protein VD883_01395 [Candidatus Omnitrophota bacterium]|nr:hypothetical protein [Candidatus Omnitrophota bacterium]